MIDITKLRFEDIGRWVNYTDGVGDKERGKLKSWNNKFIFVVYHCANQWHRFKEFTGAATNLEDLKFIIVEKQRSKEKNIENLKINKN